MRLRRRRAEPPPLAPGREIARGYEVIAHMRRGNDLDVYDVWSHQRGARCIVKTPRPDRLQRARTLRALQREGELLLSFTHPHIVRAYELLPEPPALVLETLAGATLARLLADGEASGADVAHLGLQLGSALHYIHRRGYLHLDLKPSNVIAEAGRAKLIDLSLARPPGEIGAGIGTWHYLSPEQARGGLVTEAADVWGLGAVLFEAACGEAPFDDDSDAWTEAPTDETASDDPERYPQLERRARRVADVGPVAAPLAELIDACLEPDPERRPQLPELLARLEPLADLPASERRWGRYASGR